MSPGLRSFLLMLKYTAIILVISAIVASLFYHIRKRDLFGGYIGGFVVGVIGALVGAFLLNDITTLILTYLSESTGVNVIAGSIGAYIALYIMNRLNHDKERKKY